MKQKERAQKLLKEKQDKELAECSFKPTLVSKQRARRDNADIPDSDQKINMPSESIFYKQGRQMTTESDFDIDDNKRKSKKERQAMNQDMSPF